MQVLQCIELDRVNKTAKFSNGETLEIWSDGLPISYVPAIGPRGEEKFILDNGKFRMVFEPNTWIRKFSAGHRIDFVYL